MEDRPGSAVEVRRHLARHGLEGHLVSAVYGPDIANRLDQPDLYSPIIFLDLVAPAPHVLLLAEVLRLHPRHRAATLIVTAESKRWLKRVEELGLPDVHLLERPIAEERFDALVDALGFRV
ncbi:MAG: hypothetical protein KY455_13335 [Euryarchaeota archaeon]|nr:hypothetical protein [Euryarchaeota archaeon]